MDERLSSPPMRTLHLLKCLLNGFFVFFAIVYKTVDKSNNVIVLDLDECTLQTFPFQQFDGYRHPLIFNNIKLMSMRF